MTETSYIHTNRTRYSTEDLEALCQWIQDSLLPDLIGKLNALSSHNNRNYYMPRLPQGENGLRIDYLPEMTFDRDSGWNTVKLAGQRRYGTLPYRHKLKIASPGKVAETLHGLQLVNFYAESVLPRKDVESLARAILFRSLIVENGGFRPYQVGNMIESVSFPSDPPRVRFLDRVADPNPRRKRTGEEKRQAAIERHKEWYGEGGRLKGTDHRSSGRSATYQWHERLKEAWYYYEREREYRERHRQALSELGETVPPYETFPEYLLRLADEIEISGKIRG